MTTLNYKPVSISELPDGTFKNFVKKILFPSKIDYDELFKRAGEFEESHCEELYGTICGDD